MHVLLKLTRQTSRLFKISVESHTFFIKLLTKGFFLFYCNIIFNAADRLGCWNSTSGYSQSSYNGQLQLHFPETVPQVRLLPDLWGPLTWESGELGVSIYSILGLFSKVMQNVMAVLS